MANKYSNLITPKEKVSLTCKECNKECKNLLSLGAHLYLHKMKFRDYLVKHYMNGEHPKCQECGDKTEYVRGGQGFLRFCKKHGNLGRAAWSKENGFGAKQDPNQNNGKTKETCPTIKAASEKRILKKHVFKKYLSTINKKYILNMDYAEYSSADQEVTCLCKKCKLSLTSSFTNFRKQTVRCYKCNPNGSLAEIAFVEEIMDRFQLSFDDIKRNTRTIIPPNEIDLFIPSHKLGIEYHGLFWHSYPNKAKKYHQSKALAALNSGNQVLQFFADEVDTKKEIVLSIIANKLGKSQKFDARKMKIIQVSASVAGAFYESNHLSGRGRLNNNFNYALMNGNEMISCLSLGKYLKTSSMEIMRFANKINCNVRGAFSRLLSHFIKANGYSGDIFSYCDLRIGNGSVYLVNGFSLVKTTKPDYWYTNNTIREHRFKYRAQNGLSEVDFAKSKNMSPIYGAGSHLYKKTV